MPQSAPPDEKFRTLLLWLVFCSFTLLVWSFHEPWTDEADSWLVARDGGFWGILNGARLRGTPILWYLLQLIPAQLGLPYWTQGILSLLIGDALAAVIIFRAPFPYLIRVLLVFSSHYAFEYSIIARNYGLTVLFVFLALDSFKERRDHPIFYGTMLGLAANTSIHGIILASCITLPEIFSSRREREARIAALVSLFFVALSVLQIWQAPSNSVLKNFYLVSMKTASKALVSAFAPALPGIPLWYALGLAVLISLVLTFAAARSWYAMIFWISGLASLLTLFVTIWWSPRHSGMIFTLAVSTLWILTKEGQFNWNRGQVGCVVLSLLSPFLSTEVRVQNEIVRPYSASFETGNFIRNHYPNVNQIVVFREMPGLAVAPYLPGVKFHYLPSGREGTYAIWDEAFYRGLLISQSEVVSHLAGTEAGQLVLSTEKVQDPANKSLRLVFESSSNSIMRDRFWLYERSQ